MQAMAVLRENSRMAVAGQAGSMVNIATTVGVGQGR